MYRIITMYITRELLTDDQSRTQTIIHLLDPDLLGNRKRKCPVKCGLENNKWFYIQKSSSCHRVNCNNHMESVESKGQ